MDEGRARFLRWAVPAVPFAFSLALSLLTAGPYVFWQDSGFFLVAVKDAAVLYPPGFVLYVLLAKAWTVVVAPVVGFTLAVHAFSAFCAAGAAAFLALGARAFLRRLRPDVSADGPAVAAAMLTSAGYCFWNASTLAKPYALFSLALSVLLWLMVRAEKRSDFFWMGAALGAAGAVHPSAAMLVPAMIVYAAARRDKVRELGAGGVAAVVGIAAVVAFAPSFIGLPILSARESVSSLGDARGPGEVWSHVRGSNFTNVRGAWGFDLARGALAATFVWEEFLGVGLAVLGIGLWRLWAERRGMLLPLAAWVAPMFVLPLVFVGEGMFDQWFVAAYLPLAFVTASGFAWIQGRIRVLFPASIATAVAWMIVVNYGNLNFRHYDLAETYGRMLLREVEPGAIFVASTDDSIGLPRYLQRVKGERPDVRLVSGEFVGLEWYDRRMERDLGVRAADLDAIRNRTVPQLLTVTAIANANVAPGKPVYSERPADPRSLRPGLVQVPAGVLWKTAVEAEATPRLTVPDLDPFAVARLRRRARGVFMRHTSKGMAAAFEPYENRLIAMLVQAKLRATAPLLAKDPATALNIYEKARLIDPSLEVDCAFQYDYGLALYQQNRFAPAEEAFRRVLELEPGPMRETMAHFYLAEFARMGRRIPEAKSHYERALRINGAEPQMMQTIRMRAGEL